MQDATPASPLTVPRLEGAPNFRAVEPLPAAGGRLRAARIFRSDALHRLTDADLGTFAALDIGAVLDLRRDDERGQMPSRWPARAPREVLTFDVLPDLQAVRAGGWRVQLAETEFDAGGAHRCARRRDALQPALQRRRTGTNRPRKCLRIRMHSPPLCASGAEHAPRRHRWWHIQ
jgi:hypothetical protein